MKLRNNYVLRKVADTWVVLPIGEETMNFNGVIQLNETASFLWNKLENGTDREGMGKALTDTYDITLEHALRSVDQFLKALNQAGCLE